MIVVFGEILVDMIDNHNNTFEYFVGGAPFNVSYTISKLNGNTLFIGSVGDDVLGKFIINFVEGKVNNKIYIDKNHNTTEAIVINDEYGERSFSFLRKDTADYNIPFDSLKMIEEGNIIHLGSLMLSEEIGRKFADELVKKAKELNKLISFDVNYRDDIFNSRDEAISIYKKYIELADIVKFSSDEITMFSATNDINKAIDTFSKNNKVIVVTLGKDGSILSYNNHKYKADSINVHPIDTTGAGDAFYGTLLKYIDEVGFNNFINDEELIIKTLKLANIEGALSTLKKGAIAGVSSLDELLKYYK